MNYKNKKLFYSYLFLFYSFSQAFAQEKQMEWKLIWGDEFNTEGLPDPTKWQNENGFLRNKELQYYTDSEKNCRVEGGNLVLEVHKEKIKNERFEKGANFWNKNRKHGKFTSASVRTSKTFQFKYGRVEVRAKLPQGLGMWPAIWMMGEDKNKVGWPARGEIDIMEHVGFNPDVVYANIHTKAYNHVMGTNKGDSLIIENIYDDFHVYALNWFEDRLEFFVDDIKYFIFQNENTGHETWPFYRPHYFLLNLAYGGTWGGMKGIDPSVLPQRYLIDYIRVYQQN